MNKEITEFQTYDGEVLGRLWMDPKEKAWMFIDLDEEEPELHYVKHFTYFDDEILINCHDGCAYRF